MFSAESGQTYFEILTLLKVQELAALNSMEKGLTEKNHKKYDNSKPDTLFQCMIKLISKELTTTAGEQTKFKEHDAIRQAN